MGALNMDKMKSKLDNESKSGGNYQNADYDKLVDGKNVRRILWPKGNKDEFWSEGYVHFQLGAEGKSIATCAKTFGAKNKCPICEEVERLQASKDKDDKALAENIKAKRRIYINVLNRDADEEEETPKVLAIGVTILKGLLEAICDPDYGDITDFEEGRDMTIKKTGKGLKTEYSVLPKPKASSASEELTKEELEEKMTDLDGLFIEKTYEELEAILNGEELKDKDSDDEDDEETPEDESDVDYDEMDVDELEELCKERKIKLPAKVTRLKLISLLERYDEESNSEDDEDDEETSEDESEGNSDELQDEIAKALADRKKNKK